MFEVVVGCLVIAAAAWMVRRQAGWSLARKLTVVGACVGTAGTLAMAGTMGCVASRLDATPGSPNYCPEGTSAAWGWFWLVAWVLSVAFLAGGAGVGFIDRRAARSVG